MKVIKNYIICKMKMHKF